MDITAASHGVLLSLCCPPPRNRKRPTLRASVPKRGWAANGTLASDNDSCMPL